MTKAFLPSDIARPGLGELAHFARCLLLGRGNLSDTAAAAERIRAPERVRRLTKAALEAGSITDIGDLSDWRILASAFAETLRNESLLDRLLADRSVSQVPLGARVVSASSIAVGAVVAEATWKPISRTVLSRQKLEELKAVAILAFSDEVVEAVGDAGMRLILAELRRAVAAASDEAFVAIVRTGAVSVPGGGSSGFDAVMVDLGALVDAVAVTAESRLYLAMPAPIAARLSVMSGGTGFAFPGMTPSGGTLAGMPVVVARSLSDDEVLLVDGRRLAVGVAPIMLEPARHATLRLDDDPAQSSAMTSIWQTNLLALRAERRIGADFIGDDSGAAAVLEGVMWGAPMESGT